jgi:hypothetical protein
VQRRDLAPDDLAGERAATGTVDPQHDGLDRVVVQRVAQLRRERIGADRAGRLLTRDDLAGGDDHRHRVVRLGLERLLRVDISQIGPVIDADERVRVLVLAGDLDQALLDVGATAQPGDEARIERHLRQVAVRAVQLADDVVRVVLQHVGLDAAGLRHIGLVRRPDRVEPGAAFLALGRRHVVAAECLDGRLVLTDAEHVPVDRKLVDRVLEIEPVVLVALDERDTARVEVDLVGVRREVILALIVVVGVRDDRLAARAEPVDRFAQLGELGDPCTLEPAEVEVQRPDAVIVRGGFDRFDEVAQQRLRGLAPQTLRNRALDGIALELLDHGALGCNHECRVARHDRDRPRQHTPQRAEQHEQHDEVQDLAERIETAPQPTEQSSNRAHHSAFASIARGAAIRPFPRSSPTCRRGRAGSRAWRGGRCHDA